MGQSPAKPKLSLPVHEDADQLRLRTWVQLVRAYHVVGRRLAALLDEQGLTLPQFDVLATLRHSAGLTQQELARHLLVTKGNVCGLLDRLGRLGWVERRADAADARTNRVHLTAAGRRKIDAVLPRHDALVLGVLGGQSDGEVRALRRALEAAERSAAAT